MPWQDECENKVRGQRNYHREDYSILVDSLYSFSITAGFQVFSIILLGNKPIYSCIVWIHPMS